MWEALFHAFDARLSFYPVPDALAVFSIDPGRRVIWILSQLRNSPRPKTWLSFLVIVEPEIGLDFFLVHWRVFLEELTDTRPQHVHATLDRLKRDARARRACAVWDVGGAGPDQAPLKLSVVKLLVEFVLGGALTARQMNTQPAVELRDDTFAEFLLAKALTARYCLLAVGVYLATIRYRVQVLGHIVETYRAYLNRNR